ncbi:hypothetical protein PG994_012203 [Apiospora phragmitis]|uniref:Alternative sulfate transporter n=1 Tax=Apiospora phragmitis TaxID=2905665 RepID=A0ABR1TV09_9PEZI
MDKHSVITEDNEFPNRVVDWSPEEERKAKRKLDYIIMPILTLGFFCLQLDRGNMANAITDRFMEDVGIDQDQSNVGQQMLSLGIVLTEIPSNMVLYRAGPGRWLTLQLFLFGLRPFLATRLLLGVAESGFIPGGLYTLSTWYTRAETAKRVMVYYFGNQAGQASAKLLAYGILHLRGVGGQPGWFWLFALMGAFTVLSGFVFGFVFGNLVSNAMAAVGLFLQVPVSNLRGETVMLGFFCRLLGYIFNRAFTDVNLHGMRYFGVVWTQSIRYLLAPPKYRVAVARLQGLGAKGTSDGWLLILSVLCKYSVIMGANIAGIYGAQIFRQDDRPLYQRGFSVAIAVLCVGFVIALGRWIDDKRKQRKKRHQLEAPSSSSGVSNANVEDQGGGLASGAQTKCC